MTSPGKEGAGQHVYALEPPRYLDHCIEMPSHRSTADAKRGTGGTRALRPRHHPVILRDIPVLGGETFRKTPLNLFGFVD